MNGSLVLYRMEHAYNMFDMNVTGEVLRTVSMTYSMTVGVVDAKVSVIIEPIQFWLVCEDFGKMMLLVYVTYLKRTM